MLSIGNSPHTAFTRFRGTIPPRALDVRGMQHDEPKSSGSFPRRDSMRFRRTRRRALVAGGAIVAVLSISGYAFTASNTVPNATLGQGANTISGYTISSVSYAMNATTPANIDSVSFTISPTTASTVKIQLVSGGSWYACTNTSGSVSCATISPQATAGAADSLDVVAAQ